MWNFMGRNLANFIFEVMWSEKFWFLLGEGFDSFKFSRWGNPSFQGAWLRWVYSLVLLWYYLGIGTCIGGISVVLSCCQTPCTIVFLLMLVNLPRGEQVLDVDGCGLFIFWFFLKRKQINYIFFFILSYVIKLTNKINLQIYFSKYDWMWIKFLDGWFASWEHLQLVFWPR